MTKGLPWTIEEETQLNALINANTPLEVIAAKLGRQPGAIVIKCQRLGLSINSDSKFDELPIPEELPSVEEALKMIAGALQAAASPGLSRAEIQRLQLVAKIATTYKEVLADYIDYRGIEAKLVDMEVKNAELNERLNKTSSSHPDSKDSAPATNP